MGDRNNPIKFGPEWLRNLPRERSAARSSATGQSASGGGGGASGTGSSAGAAASPGPTPSSATNTSHTNTSKVLLAKLRYGREEMLALYDRNSEAPSELKFIDTLYQPRGKQPLALNYSFEDDMRDSMRSAPPIGGISSRDSFGMGRGSVRGITMEGRGRPRGFVRQTSAGRGTSWHAGTPRLPSYSGGPDDEGGSSRSWNSPLAGRCGGDQPDWSNNKMFRNKRQGTGNTNWRQQSRDDGDEWRSSEAGRSRPLDKWDRDWGERPSGDKSQSWNSNRRTWVGGETHNHEENLPEWAAENAECSGGTFDSSGAFHGYSNDDTNLPKHQDSSYALTRSHTHGSFARSKTVEEGSDEWWASEKAKKLSPKRFDASDIKFKKQSNNTAEASSSGPSKEHHTKPSTRKEEQQQEVQEKAEAQATAPEHPENTDQQQNDDKFSNNNVYAPKFGESKKFDAMMRNDINMEEASDERGNFQSVIITPNNSLRQKHQHLVPANEGKPPSSGRQGAKTSANSEMDHGSHKSPEDLVNNIFGMPVEDKEMISTPSPNSRMGIASPGIAMGSSNNTLGQNHSPNLNMGMANPGLQMDPNKQGIPAGMHQATGMSAGLLQQGIPAKSASGIQATMPTGMQQVGLQNSGLQAAGIQNPALQAAGMQNPTRQGGGLQNSGLQGGGMQPGLSNLRGQTPGMQSVMQPVGITNSALNASLGLPIVPGGNMALPMTNVPPPVYPNVCMANNMSGALGASGLPGSMGAGNMAGFQSGLPGLNNANVGSNSLFLGQNANNPSMSSSSDIPMPNHGGQNNMFPMHGMPHAGSPGGFGNSIYSNNGPNLAEQWYYEDPKRNIQGPFSSKDMYNWYRAGFFTPSLMVRRACETIMRPLGSYGPGVPFAPVDMMGAFPISGAFDSRSQTSRDPMLNSQGSLGLDVDLLWGQPSNDLMWMQQPMGSRNDTRVNNLSMFFWDQQPSAIASNSLLSEDITKEMKTEDQILAQLRASQNLPQPPTLPFTEQPAAPAPPPSNSEEVYQQGANPTPNLEELHKLIQKDATLAAPVTAPTPVPAPADAEPSELQVEKPLGSESTKDDTIGKVQTQSKPAEAKPAKQAKADLDKAAKNKENNNTKAKNKKSKDEKKEDVADIKIKDEDALKGEKRSQESSPSKTKKEDKSNKKELEREKKEWIKEGFTIVKGAEKTVTKDIKKKAEEARAAEEAERKRKENEKLAAEEEKRKKQAEILRKQQEQQQQRQAESVAKKAPWSAAAGAGAQAPSRDLPTLAEIQRLEREKKLEQMKEQQHMMQLIAQQQAAALAREQEVQANLGWAKKQGSNANAPGQSLAEIQAEARKQAAAASQAAAQAAHLQAIEEAQAASAVTTTNHVPWANNQNGGGFWDTQLNQPSQPEKPQEPAKTPEVKTKKKVTLVIPKKETSPAVEFESWCTGFLAPWSSKIDVPTFVGFLKDIESPYEVKDYVKCYLGDSKESNDFARQFLERRSKLLRVGMVTPSDDLCSPAMAINPRTPSSEYQEIKNKGKKTKKNKMLKVDARILGFSVTASEDRINVGDIDTV